MPKQHMHQIMAVMFAVALLLLPAMAQSGNTVLRNGNLNGSSGNAITVNALQFGHIPQSIINDSNDYIISLVGKGYFNKYFNLSGTEMLNNSGNITYMVSYQYKIPYPFLAVEGGLDITGGMINVAILPNGNVTAYDGPRIPHTFNITPDQIRQEAVAYDLGRNISVFVTALNDTDGRIYLGTKYTGINLPDGYVFIAAGNATYVSGPISQGQFLLYGIDNGTLLAKGTWYENSEITAPGSGPSISQITALAQGTPSTNRSPTSAEEVSYLPAMILLTTTIIVVVAVVAVTVVQLQKQARKKAHQERQKVI